MCPKMASGPKDTGEISEFPKELGVDLGGKLGRKLVNNPLASQAAAAAAAAAMGSIASSQAFGNTLSSLQGVTGQLVTNAQGQIFTIVQSQSDRDKTCKYLCIHLESSPSISFHANYPSHNVSQSDILKIMTLPILYSHLCVFLVSSMAHDAVCYIEKGLVVRGSSARVLSISGKLEYENISCIIGTIPLMPNPGPSSQTASGTQGLQVQPITPQLLTNAQGQIIATVIGNQILPVINTQGITLSPIKPGQQKSVDSGGGALTSLSLLDNTHNWSVQANPQTAAGEVDGVNLEEIREFAKAFKIRRLSLGLTQTQVGQALSATEGPAYSQSAICRHTILRSHFFLPQEAQENTIASSLTAKLNPGLLYPARFEKLDITPKSAQKIKPVLERWMAEAEARHRAGMQNLTEFIGSEPSKKRKRRTSFTPQALEILNAHFEKNTHPSGQEMTEIAEKLNYDREVVRVWFCNKRQALKNTIKRLKQHEPATAVPLEPLTDSLEENS
ncbi:hypothetical protein MJG53_006551 [Ovis ammon polii x Ovis aries]|uniref:Uncharacterized protein n=1 Tax=Ovis ammon polii x Ovis aries TaxID=2918886 RepID=A0ACB9V547_9CETA|nr:hypothetical protein MJG53_006551 [Ovis ammon polii x Ovis aries]